MLLEDNLTEGRNCTDWLTSAFCIVIRRFARNGTNVGFMTAGGVS